MASRVSRKASLSSPALLDLDHLTVHKETPWNRRAIAIWHDLLGPGTPAWQITKALKPIAEDPSTKMNVFYKAIELYCHFRPYRCWDGSFANWSPTGGKSPDMRGVHPHDLAAAWMFWSELAEEVLVTKQHLLYIRPELFRRSR